MTTRLGFTGPGGAASGPGDDPRRTTFGRDVHRPVDDPAAELPAPPDPAEPASAAPRNSGKSKLPAAGGLVGRWSQGAFAAASRFGKAASGAEAGLPREWYARPRPALVAAAGALALALAALVYTATRKPELRAVPAASLRPSARPAGEAHPPASIAPPAQVNRLSPAPAPAPAPFPTAALPAVAPPAPVPQAQAASPKRRRAATRSAPSPKTRSRRDLDAPMPLDL